MQQTLLQVKKLEKFLQKHGEEPLLSGTISKMFDFQVRKYEGKIKELDRDLRRFERIYKKESAVFYKAFQKGKLGDEIDFIEWSSLYQLRENLLEKKNDLVSCR